jgi:hypothetical protein
MTTKNSAQITGFCPSCGNSCNLKKDLDAQDYCNDCRPGTPTSRLAEELAKFRNGEERYASNDIFIQALNSLAAGVGVYAVLDSVLRRLDFQRIVYVRQKEEIRQLTEKLKKYEAL